MRSLARPRRHVRPAVCPWLACARRGGACALAPWSNAPYPAAMQAHRAETTLTEDGVLSLHDVPFRRGESVEVIVLSSAKPAASASRYPLRGTPVTLIAPTEPVAEADWEATG